MILIFFIVVMALFGVLFGLLLPIFAIVDILRSRFHGNDNILFMLLVIFLPCCGSIIYFIVGPSRKIPRTV